MFTTRLAIALYLAAPVWSLPTGSLPGPPGSGLPLLSQAPSILPRQARDTPPPPPLITPTPTVEDVTYHIVYTTRVYHPPLTTCDIGSDLHCFSPENAHNTIGSFETITTTIISVSQADPTPTVYATRPNAFDHPFEAAAAIPQVPVEARPIWYEERDHKKLRSEVLWDHTGVNVFFVTLGAYSTLALIFWFCCRYKTFRLFMGSREDIKPLEQAEDRQKQAEFEAQQAEEETQKRARRKARKHKAKRKALLKEKLWRESEVTLTEIPFARHRYRPTDARQTSFDPRRRHAAPTLNNRFSAIQDGEWVQAPPYAHYPAMYHEQAGLQTPRFSRRHSSKPRA